MRDLLRQFAAVGVGAIRLVKVADVAALSRALLPLRAKGLAQRRIGKSYGPKSTSHVVGEGAKGVEHAA